MNNKKVFISGAISFKLNTGYNRKDVISSFEYGRKCAIKDGYSSIITPFDMCKVLNIIDRFLRLPLLHKITPNFIYDFLWSCFMTQTLKKVEQSDIIYFLPDYKISKGAIIEESVAKFNNKTCIYLNNYE